MVSEKVKRFNELSLRDKLRKIRCGFELETQSIDHESMGELLNSGGETETDYEALGEHVRATLREYWRNGLSGRLWQRLEAIREEATSEFLSDKEEDYELDSDDETTIRDQIEDDLSEVIETYALDTYPEEFELRSERDCDEICDELFGCNSGLKVEADGSVSGPEIQTNGACTPLEFMQLAKLVFKKRMDIDTECSFHIHLSVEGLTHCYGELLQSAIYKYIYDNYDRVPVSVKERWENKKWREQYFELSEQNNKKYQFVAWRPEHNTVEFRCWGNVTNVEDAKTCLILSISALLWAYENEDVGWSFCGKDLAARIDKEENKYESEAA